MLTVTELPLNFCEVYHKLDKHLEAELEKIKAVNKYKVNIKVDRSDSVLTMLRLTRINRCIATESLITLNESINV